ncbi:MAG: hypothetical protein R3345_15535, partial [Fulvivirga sp.]|nr:hypothetical protein [Fulvivirga sp.]
MKVFLHFDRTCWLLITGLVLMCGCSVNQLAHRANKKLAEQEYAKAGELTIKALEKDSLSPAVWYLTSKYLLTYENPAYYDSAYQGIQKALNIYDTLDNESKDQLHKFHFDSVRFSQQKQLIDSLAFVQAEKTNTLAGYNTFIQKYATAKQIPLARSKRNALAFARAKEMNSYESYKQFMEMYPDAVQVPEAKRRYEKLYFDQSTADGRVTSYIRFLEKNPETPYRKEAEQ